MDKRIVELALEALQARKAAIDAEIAKLTGEPPTQKPETIAPTAEIRRRRTAGERRKHSQRMKAIWAARKAQAAKPKAEKPTQAKAKAGGWTDAQRKAHSKAMRLAWAKRRSKE